MKIWFDRMWAKGHGRFSLLYRRSLAETGIDFTRQRMASVAITGSVAKLHFALNLILSKRLRLQDRLAAEPPCLLSLRSLVGRFYPCNCYSQNGGEIADDHVLFTHRPLHRWSCIAPTIAPRWCLTRQVLDCGSLSERSTLHRQPSP